MARIRTIKPEFWTSEQVVECPPMARLLFIGMWNFCDDQGVHPASVKRIKMEVFPGDDITSQDVTGLIERLKSVGLIVEYEVENRVYWAVTGWNHQRIKKPTFRHPPPPVPHQFPTSSEPVGNPSPPEGKGMEGNGRDKRTAPPPSAGSPPIKLEKCDDDNEKMAELKTIAKRLNKKIPTFNTAQFINHTAKKKDGTLYPPEVFIRVFSQMVEAEISATNSKAIDDPWAYATFQFEIHAGNVQEEIMRTRAQADEIPAIGDIMKQAGVPTA